MAVPTLTANWPTVGSISWSAFNIQYGGNSYAVAASNTGQKFVWWRYNAGSPVLEAGVKVPDGVIRNALVNPSFEEASPTDPTRAKSWTRVTALWTGAGISSNITTAQALSGSQSMEFISGGVANTGPSIMQPVALVPGTTMRIRVRAKASVSVNQFYVGLLTADGTGWLVWFNGMSGATIPTAWTYYESTYTVPAGITSAQFCIIGGYSQAAGTKVWVDDVEFGPDVPAALGPDDLVLFGNKNGTPINLQSASLVEGGLVVEGSILTDALSANSVTSEKILAGAVDATKIAAHTITANEIAANTITANEIAANTITADKISSNYVYAGRVTAQQVDSGNISANLGILGQLTVGAITLKPANPATADPGGLFIPLSNGGRIRLPADPAATAEFLKVVAQFTQVTVDDLLSINGANNSLAGGLIIQASTRDPRTAPTASAAWDQPATQVTAALSSTVVPGSVSASGSALNWRYDDYQNLWWSAADNLFYGIRTLLLNSPNLSPSIQVLYSVHPTTGVVTTVKEFAANTTVRAAFKIGTYWYVISKAVPTLLRTNLCPNPSFEVNANLWTSNGTNPPVRVTTQSYVGTSSLQVSSPASGWGSGGLAAYHGALPAQNSYAVEAGANYAFSAYVKSGVATRDVYAMFYWYDSSGAFLGDTTATSAKFSSSTTAWTRVSTVATAPAGAAYARMGILFNVVGGGAYPMGDTNWIDAVLFEKSSTVGAYFDGATTGSLAYAWTGTAQVSTSTESTAGSNDYAVQCFNPSNWTAQVGPTSIITLAKIVNGSAAASSTTTNWNSDGTYIYSCNGLGDGSIVTTRYPVNADPTTLGPVTAASSQAATVGLHMPIASTNGVYVGNADFGAQKVVISKGNDALVYTPTWGGSCASDSTKNWAFPSWTTQGITYDGTRFQVLGKDSSYGTSATIWKLSRNITALAAGSTIKYDYRDTNGTVAASKPSPALTLATALPARAWWQINVTDPQPSPADANKPDRYYAYINDQKVGELVIPASTLLIDLYAAGGAAPSATNTFVLGGGYLQSGAENPVGSPVIKLNGKGGGRVGPLSWDDNGKGISGVFPGMVQPYAGTAATLPAGSGYLMCDGAAVDRTTYADLFAVVGTTYGAGNGSTTFNVPNLKGRMPVGLDTAQTEFDVLGETGGSKVHSHGLASAAGVALWVSSKVYTRTGPVGSFTSNRNYIGGSTDTVATSIGAANALVGTTDWPDVGLPPYMVMNYIIKT